MTARPVLLDDRQPGELLDPEEKGLLIQCMEWYFEDLEHDYNHQDEGVPDEEYKQLRHDYDKLLKLYYVFTGFDAQGTYGPLSNYENRVERNDGVMDMTYSELANQENFE